MKIAANRRKRSPGIVVSAVVATSVLTWAVDASALRYGWSAGRNGHPHAPSGFNWAAVNSTAQCFEVQDSSGAVRKILLPSGVAGCDSALWWMAIPTEVRVGATSRSAWVNLARGAFDTDPIPQACLATRTLQGAYYHGQCLSNLAPGLATLTANVPEYGNMQLMVQLGGGQTISSYAWEYDF